ncbi:TlpA family protein disulfide reductase [Nocardioides gilvus]|uniref:TlpA family protein disulfide reductase n=1 Tax=Nocardioides gilvus TaxID=1735589 RepID=UPI000D746999|nr:TlpA disulfide reductase family protein [Nocardioides gilvus]
MKIGTHRSPLRVVAVALVGLLLTLTACSESDDAPKADTLPAPMPELTLAGFADQPERNLAEIDSPTLISLWASWCKPCRDEMPILEEFHQKYQGRVDVLGIDFQDPRSKAAEELVASTGVTYPLVSDFDGDIDGRKPFPRVGGLPLLAFVDAEGQLVAVEYVLFDELAELEEVAGKHLDLDPTADEDAA